MASNRDRLKAMSKKNSEAAKQLIDVPTLISDVAERQDTVTNEVVPVQELKEEAVEVQEPIPIEKIENDLVAKESDVKIETNLNKELDTQADLDVEKNIPSEDIVSFEDKKEDDLNNNTQISEAMSSPTVTPIEEDKNLSEEADSNPETISLSEKYQGPEVIISLLLQPESNNYLTYKAMDLRISSKQLLKDLLIKELEHGYKEDDLCPLYRRTQHQTIKRSIVIDKQLKEDIQETAIKYRMRYTAFISYVIYKAYINDSEYKELM